MQKNETFPGSFHELRAASTAGGGTALTTSAGVISLPPNTNYITLTPRNFAGAAAVAKVAFCPWLTVIQTDGRLDAESDWAHSTDVELQDGDTTAALTMNSFAAASADTDFLYVGSHVPFRGVVVNVGNANGNASVITVRYWNGSAWTDISDTDGTASSGKSLAQDGNITWTIPAAWTEVKLKDIEKNAKSYTTPAFVENAYWTRWEWSAALDSSVSILELRALARSTAYMELLSGQTLEGLVNIGRKGISGVEALTDADTANLIVNVATFDEFA